MSFKGKQIFVLFLPLQFYLFLTSIRTPHSIHRMYSELRRTTMKAQARKLDRPKLSAVGESDAIRDARTSRNIQLSSNFKEVSFFSRTEQSPENIRAFSKIVNALVLERSGAIRGGFSFTNRSLLSWDDVGALVSYAKKHFPFAYNYQLACITPDQIRGEPAAIKVRSDTTEIAALWSFIALCRKRNPTYFAELSTIISLSLMNGKHLIGSLSFSVDLVLEPQRLAPRH